MEIGLEPGLVGRIVDALGIGHRRAGKEQLEGLLTGWASRVPWESASRIVRRSDRRDLTSCPRWPGEFWEGALDRGLGGTCFESNLALYALLRSLGYEPALTINDMADDIGCHSALVVPAEDLRWLVDVGMPLYAPVPIDPEQETKAVSRFHTYTLHPLGRRRYRLERDRHPKTYMYTLNDVPVSEAEYGSAVIADYDTEAGRFLDRIVICKVVDGVQHRFCNEELPLRLERYEAGTRHDEPLGSDVARAVAARFGMPEEVVTRALELCPVRSRPVPDRPPG